MSSSSGFEERYVPLIEVPFSPSLRSEDLRPTVSMHLELIGRGRMHSGRAQIGRNTAAYRTADGIGESTSVRASGSDSILRDICVPFIPNCKGRRQTERAVLRGARVPHLRAPYNTRNFVLLNQPVAAGVEDGARQLDFVHACPEQAGSALATLISIRASLLYGVLSGSFQTQDTVSMANPEV
jgi:hypothetical protein